MRAFQILPIEPLLLRDGRPFSTDEGALDATSLNAHAGHPCRLPTHADRATTRILLGALGGGHPAGHRRCRAAAKERTVCFPPLRMRSCWKERS